MSTSAGQPVALGLSGPGGLICIRWLAFLRFQRTPFRIMLHSECDGAPQLLCVAAPARLCAMPDRAQRDGPRGKGTVKKWKNPSAKCCVGADWPQSGAVRAAHRKGRPPAMVENGIDEIM
jgi:hypothetical protein